MILPLPVSNRLEYLNRKQSEVRLLVDQELAKQKIDPSYTPKLNFTLIQYNLWAIDNQRKAILAETKQTPH
ncbi:MAG: hypothetical protein WC438_03235 [Candidatus Pacearchaeota archaeon]